MRQIHQQYPSEQLKIQFSDIQQALTQYQEQKGLLRVGTPSIIAELTKFYNYFAPQNTAPDSKLSLDQLFSLCLLLSRRKITPTAVSESIVSALEEKTGSKKQIAYLKNINEINCFTMQNFKLIFQLSPDAWDKLVLPQKRPDVYLDCTALFVNNNFSADSHRSFLKCLSRLSPLEMVEFHITLKKLQALNMLDPLLLPLLCEPANNEISMHRKAITASDCIDTKYLAMLIDECLSLHDRGQYAIQFAKLTMIMDTYKGMNQYGSSTKLTFAGSGMADIADINQFFITLGREGLLNPSNAQHFLVSVESMHMVNRALPTFTKHCKSFVEYIKPSFDQLVADRFHFAGEVRKWREKNSKITEKENIIQSARLFSQGIRMNKKDKEKMSSQEYMQKTKQCLLPFIQVPKEVWVMIVIADNMQYHTFKEATDLATEYLQEDKSKSFNNSLSFSMC